MVNVPKLVLEVIDERDTDKLSSLALQFVDEVDGVAVETEMDVILFPIAVAKGHLGAMIRLADCFASGKVGMGTNLDIAVKLYRMAINRDNAHDMRRLAYHLSHGTSGLEVDKYEAARLYRLAIDSDDDVTKP